MSRAEFSLYIMWPESTHPVARFIFAEDAVETAYRLVRSFAAAPEMRQPEAVIVTDGGDDTVFRWEPEAGVVWPEGPE